MSYLTNKFKGKYRILVPYDLSTNDFPKKLNGTNEDIDCYIACYNGSKVFHYGRDVLEAYIPSLIRGHNVIKTLKENGVEDKIYDVVESDSEVMFKFRYVNSDDIIPLLKPYTNACNRSPFSTKNLPKSDYKIPEDKLSTYKNIVSKIPQERIFTLTHTTNAYIKSLATKKNTIENIKADMKKKCMKSKEYIHYIGKWDDYIEYLEKNLEW